MIEFKSVSKRYGQKMALDALDLTIGSGEFCVLLGSSGCGKSTTLKCINRLVVPDSGDIFVRGQSVSKMDPVLLRRGIGYAFQHVGLFPHYTVAENIAVVPRLLKWEKKKISERIDELLEMFSLNPSLTRGKFPSQLSGGEAQRVGVARALASDPDLLLLDEPFGAVDPPTRKMLQGEFLEIQAKLKKTIIFVTHDIDEALTLGSQIVIMHQGKIQQKDSPLSLISNPENHFVEKFLGDGQAFQRLNFLTVNDYKNQEKLSVNQLDPQIRGEDTLFQALTLMIEKKVSQITVLDQQGNPSGTLSIDTLVRGL